MCGVGVGAGVTVVVRRLAVCGGGGTGGTLVGRKRLG